MRILLTTIAALGHFHHPMFIAESAFEKSRFAGNCRVCSRTPQRLTRNNDVCHEPHSGGQVPTLQKHERNIFRRTLTKGVSAS